MTRTTRDLEVALHTAPTPYATSGLQPGRLSTIRAGGRRHRRRRAALAVGGAAAAVVLVAGGALAVGTGVGETPAPGPVDRPSVAPERPGADGPVGTLIVDDSTPFGAAVADDLRPLSYTGRPFAEGARIGTDAVDFGCRVRAGLHDCLPARLDDDGTAQRLVWLFDRGRPAGGSSDMDVYRTEPTSALGRLLVAYVPGRAATAEVFAAGRVLPGRIDTALGDGSVVWVEGVADGTLERIVVRDADGLVLGERGFTGR